MQQYQWYATLLKPEWAPPAWIFGPVWTVLYAIIAVTYGYVFYQIAKGEFPKKLAIPFLLNLLFNALFTPIQFGLQNNLLATIDILLVLATLLWVMVAVYPHNRFIAFLNVPYLAWVFFATVLQITITLLNF